MKIPSNQFENETFEINSKERGDILIKTGGGTFPVRYLSIFPIKIAGGNIDIQGDFTPYEDLTANEKLAFRKLWGPEGRAMYFGIIINCSCGVMEPMLECKVTGGNYHFACAASD